MRTLRPTMQLSEEDVREILKLEARITELEKDKERLDEALRQNAIVNKTAIGNFYLAETRGGLDAAMRKESDEHD